MNEEITAKKSLKTTLSGLFSNKVLMIIAYIVMIIATACVFGIVNELVFKDTSLHHAITLTPDNRGDYLSILGVSYSVVFLTASLLGMLSDKEETIYWVNINERVLVEPAFFNFYTLSTLGFTSLALETVALACGRVTVIWSGFLFGVLAMVCLFYKMTTIYFRRSAYAEKIRNEYEDEVIDIAGIERKSFVKLPLQIEKLYSNTLIACEKHKYNAVHENLDFMYDMLYISKESYKSSSVVRKAFKELLGILLEKDKVIACQYIHSKIDSSENTGFIKSFSKDCLEVIDKLTDEEIIAYVNNDIGSILHNELSESMKNLPTGELGDLYLDVVYDSHLTRLVHYIVKNDRGANLKSSIIGLLNHMNPVYSDDSYMNIHKDIPQLFCNELYDNKRWAFIDDVRLLMSYIDSYFFVTQHNGEYYGSYIRRNMSMALHDIALKTDDEDIMDFCAKTIVDIFITEDCADIFRKEVKEAYYSAHSYYSQCIMKYLLYKLLECKNMNEIRWKELKATVNSGISAEIRHLLKKSEEMPASDTEIIHDYMTKIIIAIDNKK